MRAPTVEIPAPATFTDGNDPEFRVWKSALLRKFHAYSDLFPDEAFKLDYVLSYIRGEAQEALQPYLDADAGDKEITTVEGLLQWLEGHYMDPTELERAKADFHDLHQTKCESYRAFCLEFLQLAGKAKINMDDLKREFHDKLTGRLRSDMTASYLDPRVDFNTYQRLGHHYTLQYALQNKRKGVVGDDLVSGSAGSSGSCPRRHGSRSGNKTKDKGKQGSSSPGAGGCSDRPGKAHGIPDKECQKLMDAGRCFYCEEAGHKKVNCVKFLTAHLKELKAAKGKATASDGQSLILHGA